ncbi:tail fiber domain-containing protein [Serratia liquefaciens]|uniref:tail fiber domain-containing protein n=1 Tax=Serratia liquefaciens TaxID=614 RepID=UPI001F3E37D5|nr:tail fiber domain-containing protein [Serratia liquefaciens]MCE9941427.1 tail fiber domain-containing protein [Serratia liquefaciens]
MFHLDNTSGVPEMPEVKDPQSNTPRWFGESVQQGGISWPGADWFNIIQAELLAILELVGDAPDKRKYNQIAEAIKGFAGGQTDSVWETLRQAGASKNGTIQGGTLQDSVYWVTLTGDGGGIADYDPVTQTGTNNFEAFKKSVAIGMAQGRKELRIPSGNYYVKLTDLQQDINLGGEGAIGVDGMLIQGAGKERTTLWVDAESEDNILFSIRGGSGNVSFKGIRGITIRCVPKNLQKSVFLYTENACFSIVDDFHFIRAHIGIVYANTAATGHFTEFNVISNGRLNQSTTNRLYIVEGGHESFHANSVYFVQNQILPGGFGVRSVGVTAPSYLYNQVWVEWFFGGKQDANCRAIQLTKTNTDNIWGNLTHEGFLSCETTDSSVFEFKGNFSGIGKLSFNVVEPTTVKAANFVFDNILDNYAPFTRSELRAFTPALFNPQLADTMDNGVSASLWRINNAAGHGLLLNALNGSPGWKFTTTDVGQRLQQAKLKYSLGIDGNSFTAYAATLYLNPDNPDYGVQLSSENARFAPRKDATLSLGTIDYRWKQVFAVNSAIGTSNKDKKIGIRQTLSAETSAFYEIGQLPCVWQWLERFQVEGDDARLHSGPTVQDAIEIMGKYGLDWRCYSAFCYDKWDAQEEEIERWDDLWEIEPAKEAVIGDGGEILKEAIPEQRIHVRPAGSRIVKESREAGEDYGFRKEELLFWILRATIEKQVDIESRLSELEKANSI